MKDVVILTPGIYHSRSKYSERDRLIKVLDCGTKCVLLIHLKPSDHFRVDSFLESNDLGAKIPHLFRDESISLDHDYDTFILQFADHPYHNELHCASVAFVAMHLAKLVDMDKRYEYPLWAAARLHDLGHSGGVLGDDVNIKSAIELVDDNYLFPDSFIRQQVIDLIKITEFPRQCGGDMSGVIKDPGLIEAAMILRDADLITTSLSLESSDLLLRLLEEVRIKEPGLTDREFYERQVNFHHVMKNEMLYLTESIDYIKKYESVVLEELHFSLGLYK